MSILDVQLDNAAHTTEILSELFEPIAGTHVKQALEFHSCRALGFSHLRHSAFHSRSIWLAHEYAGGSTVSQLYLMEGASWLHAIQSAGSQPLITHHATPELTRVLALHQLRGEAGKTFIQSVIRFVLYRERLTDDWEIFLKEAKERITSDYM